LLAHRADPSLMDTTGKTAIIYAAARGFSAIVQRLLDAGVKADARYAHGLTALMWAAGHEEGVDHRAAAAVIGLLLDRSAPIDATDDRGRTALIIAAERGDVAAVGLLLERGADRIWQDKQGRTAFDLAASEPIRARLSTHP
jgi:ankyrin repeat protein